MELVLIITLMAARVLRCDVFVLPLIMDVHYLTTYGTTRSTLKDMLLKRVFFFPVFIAVAASVVWLWTRPHYSTLHCRIRPCSKQTSPLSHWSKTFSLNWIQEVVTYLSKPIWESHYVTVNGPGRENELFLLTYYLPKHFSEESEMQCSNQLTQSFRFCHLATDDSQHEVGNFNPPGPQRSSVPHCRWAVLWNQSTWLETLRRRVWSPRH